MNIAIQVLFLSLGDLRTALFTISKITNAYHKLNLHDHDEHRVNVVRNILLTHIMLSEDFNPSDTDFIWDIWYSLKWTKSTRDRFLKNVKELLTHNWNQPSTIILDEQSLPELEYWCEIWRQAISQETGAVSTVLLSKQR